MTSPVLRVRGRYPVEPGGKAIAPSVSMVKSVAGPGEALAWGASKEAALFAVHHRAELDPLEPPEQIDRIRKHFKGVWGEKAARGTTVHDLASRWANGETVDCPPECAPYLDALEAFWLDHSPKWLHNERSVVHNVEGLEYGGTFDAIATLADGRDWTLDFKTGKRYPVDVILQMAAYRYATALAVVDETGTFVDTEPMPEVDTCGVLYLHDDRTYELLELPADRTAHEAFLNLRRVWGWQQESEAWLKKHPEPKRETTE